MVNHKDGEQTYSLDDWIIGDVRNGLFDVLLDEGPVSWILELGLRSDIVGDVGLPQLNDFRAWSTGEQASGRSAVREVAYRVEVWKMCLIGSIQFCRALSA